MKALDIESGLWHWRMMTEKKLRQWVKVKITKSTGKIEMFLGKLQTLRGAERERDRDLQYSSCLLVIGTFQTGYCRVYTDRKLPARGVWKSPSVHPMCRHRSVTCPHTVPPSICKLCRSRIPMMAKTFLTLFSSFLFDFVSPARARIPWHHNSSLTWSRLGRKNVFTR